MRETGNFGIFAIAIEDLHHLGDRKTFASQFEYQAWLEAKRDEMEQSGLRRAAFASRFENILGLIHTQSLVMVVGGDTRMSRLGSSVLFDRPAQDMTAARAIAEAFNPHPTLYSQVQRAESSVAEPGRAKCAGLAAPALPWSTIRVARQVLLYGVRRRT